MQGPGMLVNVNIRRRCAGRNNLSKLMVSKVLQCHGVRFFVSWSNVINFTKLDFFHTWSMTKDDIANAIPDSSGGAGGWF